MTRNAQRTEMIKYDTNSVGDQWGWLLDVRGLDLGLLDAEDAQEQASNRLSRLERIVKRSDEILGWVAPAVEDIKHKGLQQAERTRKQYEFEKRNYHWVSSTFEYHFEKNFGLEKTELDMLRNEYVKYNSLLNAVREQRDDAISELNNASSSLAYTEQVLSSWDERQKHKDHEELSDISDVKDWREDTFENDPKDYNKTHWNAVWVYGEQLEAKVKARRKSGKLKPINMIGMLNVIKDKVERKELTVYHQARIGYLLNKWLGRKRDMNKCLELGKVRAPKYKPAELQVKTSSFEDRFYGEISIGSIEDAVDLMSSVRRYATLNDLDLETAYYEFCEALEEKEYL